MTEKELDPRLLTAIKLMEQSFDNSRAFTEELQRLANDPEYRQKREEELRIAEEKWRKKVRIRYQIVCYFK